jgi:hypothetical protein
MGTGAKEDESRTERIWAVGFHHVTARSRLAGVLELAKRLFNFQLFLGGRGEPRITEIVYTESVDTGHTCTSFLLNVGKRLSNDTASCRKTPTF